MSPRKPSSEVLTKEEIVNAARHQFIAKGFEKVTMRGVASQLGCSHGALYYHFKNKIELFYAVVEKDFEHLNQLLKEIINSTKENHQKLLDILICFMKFGLNHQKQYEFMFMMKNAEVDSLAHEAATKSYYQFEYAILQLKNQNTEPSLIYSAFVALHGFVSHHCGYVKEYNEVKEYAEAHALFIIKGLA
ncbi:AcrR family transcriptional regulator [Cytobacillus horneckiae]|uniref:TetR/AcrR family transcriptional regulator n=1 Tax=Cytobacillus horneckiae TaxID=549687 RepID=A0A2N0ZEI4_9BACI|nr:TetR/AcrR family transcriptional regulator [Cytobacillus horneckiae]MBN6888107.1 TetR/AcrR family transcriptional regulator [Cytobacillus horneckiae]MCM3176962.1 TetR/AcrR family transcriptional regulator [Cytobacillus horneckiae]MEC1154662.1 TetR/AcrR family transcriptional regulator [Cytobacillus horneckiae]MED2939003.1 TetR/AcrR family transcriptional regulator [Cytobacillus horneckiae]PKG27919.1 TetR/AcrR family transcriptional regulator [Cytobacillus horneckiae]